MTQNEDNWVCNAGKLAHERQWGPNVWVISTLPSSNYMI